MRRALFQRCAQLPRPANQNHRRKLELAQSYTDITRPTTRASIRFVSGDGSASRSTSSVSSHWPLTVAVSFLAFVVGWNIDGSFSRGKNAVQKTSSQVKDSTLNSDQVDHNQEAKTSEKSTKDASQSDASASEQADPPKDRDEGDEPKLEEAAEEEADEDRIVKPELSDEDAKGWREFADTVHEKYGEKLGALRELQSKHAELQSDYDDVSSRFEWAKIDSQRNAELFFENVARKDVYKGMIRDDEILKACPLKPPEGLFDEEIKPSIIRILDDKDMTRTVLINLEGEAPSGSSENSDKQWDYVYDWVSDLVKLMQQSGQISDESFWNMLWSKGWYKCGFPAYSFPDREKDFPTTEMKAMIERLKSTSDSGMERYHVMTEKSHLLPFSDRLGTCSTTATVYPGDLTDDGKARNVQVLVDTGAEITVIAKHNVPKDVKELHTYPITVSGFGGGSASLNRRVQLRIKLHGEDEDKGIDIVTTAYVMDKTASGLGVELGTDVMKPLGPKIDIDKGIMTVVKDGKTYEAPLLYLREDDKIKEPTPQIGDSTASGEAPPEGKVKPQQEQSEPETGSQQRRLWRRPRP